MAGTVELAGVQLCIEDGGELPVVCVGTDLVIVDDAEKRSLLALLPTADLNWLEERLTAASAPASVEAQAAVRSELAARR